MKRSKGPHRMGRKMQALHMLTMLSLFPVYQTYCMAHWLKKISILCNLTIRFGML